MSTFPLRIGTPDGLLFEGNVERVICRTVSGDLAILARHCNYCNAAVQTVQVPRLAVADILIQDKRLILGQNTDGINVGVDTVGEREIDDTIFSAKRTGRLGELLGQRIEA